MPCWNNTVNVKLNLGDKCSGDALQLSIASYFQRYTRTPKNLSTLIDHEGAIYHQKIGYS